jgi:hypothetical protein
MTGRREAAEAATREPLTMRRTAIMIYKKKGATERRSERTKCERFGKAKVDTKEE